MLRSIGLQTLQANLRWRLTKRSRQAVGTAPIVLDRAWKAPEAPTRDRPSLCVALGIIALMVATAKAQDAEPRSYTNTPVGLNFLIAGYVYSQGKIAFDPQLSIADAQFHTHTEALAYVRSLDVGGKSAKFDVILPYSSFSAHALVDGQPKARSMSGFGDPRFRFSINLFGAPALSVRDFANYQQDLIVGVSLQVSAPLGQYDNSKLLNLGNNRWSFRPGLGVSKAWGPWTVEVVPSVIFFTDNPDFFNGSTFAQAPIYLVQGHIIYVLILVCGCHWMAPTLSGAAPP